MTTEEKIRYLRKKRMMTQEELSKAIGVHPVTIRKYETGKLRPTEDQLEKMADVFGVGRSVLCGGSISEYRLQTVGDLYNCLINSIKAGQLYVKGKRDKEGMIEDKSFFLVVNEVISGHFHISDMSNHTEAPLASICFSLDDAMMRKNLLKWEKIYRHHQSLLQKYQNAEDPAIQARLQETSEMLEQVELELASDPMSLNMDHGISVKIQAAEGKAVPKKAKTIARKTKD